MNILLKKIKSENFFLISILCVFLFSTFGNYLSNYFQTFEFGIAKYFFLGLVFAHLFLFVNSKHIIFISIFLIFFFIKFLIFDNQLFFEIKLFSIILLFYLIYVKMNSEYSSSLKRLSIFLFTMSYLIITSQYIWKIQPLFHFFIYYWPDSYPLKPYLNFPLFTNKNHLCLIVILNYCLIISIILDNFKNFKVLYKKNNLIKFFISINKNYLFFIIYTSPYLIFYTNLYTKLILISFVVLILLPKIYHLLMKKKVIIFILLFITFLPIVYKTDYFIKSNFFILNNINNIFLKIYHKQKPFSCNNYIHELVHYKAPKINKTLCIKKNLHGSPQNFAWTTLQSITFRVSYSNTYFLWVRPRYTNRSRRSWNFYS